MNFIDQSVLAFFVANRFEWLSFLMLVITYSGGYMLVGGLALFSAISFYIHKHTDKILPLFVSVGGSALTVFVLKNIFYLARPLEAVYLESGSSFPSGHATMAMALYGFLIYAIWSHSAEASRDKNRSLHKFLTIFLGILIVLVGASRLYLGVHYFSDVLGGFAIGLIWIIASVKLKNQLRKLFAPLL